MPNTYFDFKQFRVDQNLSGMKVTTEGCILGAWAHHSAPARILDIGTGTGLLSLMLAQRYPQAQIEAVELNTEASGQAVLNFSNSPWSTRLNLHNLAIQGFTPDSGEPFDLIICNPPFYQNDLKSADTQKAMATHNDHLTSSVLVNTIQRLLKTNGSAFVLYPVFESEGFEKQLGENGLYAMSKLYIRDKINKPVFRRILRIGKKCISTPKQHTLIIKDQAGNYTQGFTDLLRAYYL